MNKPCIDLTSSCFINGFGVSRQTTIEDFAYAVGMSFRTAVATEGESAFAHFDECGISVVFELHTRTVKCIRLKFFDEPLPYLTQNQFSGDLVIGNRHFIAEGWKIIEDLEAFDFLPTGLVLFPSDGCALWLEIDEDWNICTACIEWETENVGKLCKK